MINMMTRDTDLTSNRLFSKDNNSITLRDPFKESFIERLKIFFNNYSSINIDINMDDDFKLETNLAYKLAKLGIFFSEKSKQEFELKEALYNSNNGLACCRCGRIFSVIGLFDKRYGIKSKDDPLMCTICEEELRKESKLKEIILSLK